MPNREMAEEKIVAPLKKIIRVATPKDEDIELKNREKEKDAYKICVEKIAKHGLEMKLIAAEYTFDNNKLLFYFTADGRIDFRELVKDLASVFRTRIELRQIGVRDETKSAAELESAEERCAATVIYPSLRRFRLKWQRSRIFP